MNNFVFTDKLVSVAGKAMLGVLLLVLFAMAISSVLGFIVVTLLVSAFFGIKFIVAGIVDKKSISSGSTTEANDENHMLGHMMNDFDPSQNMVHAKYNHGSVIPLEGINPFINDD